MCFLCIILVNIHISRSEVDTIFNFMLEMRKVTTIERLSNLIRITQVTQIGAQVSMRVRKSP